MHRSYFVTGEDWWAQNELTEILHNATEFFTTGSLQGQVFVTNNVESPDNVLVWVISDSHQSLTGRPVGTALTTENGLYNIEGLVPASYRLFAYKTGFAAQNPERVYITTHTNAFVPTAEPPVLVSGITTSNILLVPVQPGTLRGVVRDSQTNQPLAGVTVTIRDITNTVQMTTTTGADGTYVFNAVPAGLYIVTVPEQTVLVDGVPQIFSEFSTPLLNPVDVKTDTSPTTTAGDTVYNVNLTRRPVPPEPATLEITVLDESGEAPGPAVGAQVTVTDAVTGAVVPIFEGGVGENPCTVDETGVCTMTIRAGQVNIRVTYQDYTAQTRSMLVQPDEMNPAEKTSVTFRFGGVIHVFPAGNVLMTSAPYNYTGTQASPLFFSDVLNLTDEQLEDRIVAYNSSNSSWVYYPTYPADTFRAGVGYGMRLPEDGKVTEFGNLVSTTNGYFVVRANIGWNLIGNPFPGDIVWSKANATGGDQNVKFALRDDPNLVLHDIGDTADQVSGSVILTGDLVWGGSSTDQYGNGVYNGNYAQHTVIRPWQAYWVKVAQPVLFYFPRVEAPEQQSVLRLGSREYLDATRTTMLPSATTWGLDITATSGDLSDRGLGLGVSSRATAGLDAGLDIPKPSPMSSNGPSLFTSFILSNNEMLATDVRGVGNNDWNFTVNTNLNSRNITLTWTPTGRLAQGATLTLVDTATGQRVNMSSNNQYTFRSARSGGLRRFRVELRGAVTGRTQ